MLSKNKTKQKQTEKVNKIQILNKNNASALQGFKNLMSCLAKEFA